MRHRSVLLPGRGFSLLLCLVLIFSAASLSDAQSGRKVPKRTQPPDPQTTTPSEPPITTPQPEQNAKPALQILVTKFLPNVNSSNVYTDIVIEGIMARLAHMKGIKVQVGREMNRKQASDAAKESDDRYVVWIELLVDTVDQERASYGQVSPYYLYVDYAVFTPGTGKQKTAGHVYQRRGIGAGQGPLPVPNTSGAADYTLRKAGEETADRILEKLDLITPPVIRH